MIARMKLDYDYLSLWQILTEIGMLNPFKPGISIIILMGLMAILFSSCKSCKHENAVVTTLLSPGPEIVKDYDGNQYTTVTIGTQDWLVENLKATRYQNGDPIQMVTEDAQWNKQTTGAFCNFDQEAANGQIYGHLYNWYAVNDPRNICPKGWRVPTDADWDVLSSALGGDVSSAGKMKDATTRYWDSPNVGATNESGFTALPGGYRSIKGEYNSMGSFTFFWSSSGYASETAWCRWMQSGNDQLDRIDNYKNFGFSVRCIREE
jgi:uncharacterized protein (TIGR02145 family)